MVIVQHDCRIHPCRSREETARLCKKAAGNPVVITHQNKDVGYLVASGDMEARIETLEIMANPKAMKAIRDAKAGRTKYHPVEVLGDES